MPDASIWQPPWQSCLRGRFLLGLFDRIARTRKNQRQHDPQNPMGNREAEGWVIFLGLPESRAKLANDWHICAGLEGPTNRFGLVRLLKGTCQAAPWTGSQIHGLVNDRACSPCVRMGFVGLLLPILYYSVQKNRSSRG